MAALITGLPRGGSVWGLGAGGSRRWGGGPGPGRPGGRRIELALAFLWKRKKTVRNVYLLLF